MKQQIQDQQLDKDLNNEEQTSEDLAEDVKVADAVDAEEQDKTKTDAQGETEIKDEKVKEEVKVEQEVKIEPEYKKLKARKRGSGSYKTKLGKKRKKAHLPVKRGKAYVFATYNNTHITLTDLGGNVIASASAGECGFKGPKKATPYAAGVIVKTAVDKAKQRGFEEASVFVKGVGLGREAAVRSLYANGVNIVAIKDITPVPHNGCRPKKPRRV